MNRAKLVARTILVASLLTVTASVGALVYTSRHQLQGAPDGIPQAIASPQAANLRVTHPYVGVFERGVPATFRPVRAFGKVAGVRPDITVYYSGWHDPFQARFATAARRQGAVVLVQMQPRGYSMASIAAGHSDNYLRSYARAVRDYGHQVILSFAPEANGRWYAWGYHHTAPALWIAAWRHVVTLFRNAGAVNVTWLWDVNIDGKLTGPIRDWWPGRKYVNWVGLDGYYFRPTSTFASTFGRSVTEVRRFTSSPVLISEAGIGPVAGQAAKIPGLFAGIREDHLLGLIWFDVAQHGGLFHQDWRLEGHQAAIAKFQAGVRSLRP